MAKVLEGVRVNIDNKPAFVRYISPSQVNVQVPDAIAGGTGGPVVVEVVNSAGRSTTTVQASRVSPALLTTPTFNVNNKQYVAALFPDFQTFVGPTGLIPGVSFRPAKPGDTKPALRPDAWAPTRSASITTTDQPRRATSRAMVSPASPAPITHRSTSRSWLSARRSGAAATRVASYQVGSSGRCPLCPMRP